MNRWIPIVLFVSLAINIVGVVNYARDRNRMQTDAKQKIEQAQRQKTIDFLKIFVVKVLKAKGEVGFEDRLKLENAVRELGDAEVLRQWQKFVDSKESEVAQNNLKELLGLLVQRL